MMVQEIEVIEATSSQELVKEVNQRLSSGWKLVGGLQLVPWHGQARATFYQTIFREYEQPGAWG